MENPVSTTLSTIEIIQADDGARVRALAIGITLGLKRSDHIKRLIDRNRAEFERYGPLYQAAAMVQLGSGAAREVADYLLNEEQSVLATVLSKAPRAPDAREIVIRTFVEHRRGERERAGQLSPASESVMAVGPLAQIAGGMAEAMGMTGNDRALFVLKTIRQEPGGRIVEQNIHELGLLEAARPEPLMTPTALGKEIGSLSAQKVNRRLVKLGLQTRVGDDWKPTQKALDAELCRMLDTNKKHSDGTPVTQLKWFASVLSELRKEEETA